LSILYCFKKISKLIVYKGVERMKSHIKMSYLYSIALLSSMQSLVAADVDATAKLLGNMTIKSDADDVDSLSKKLGSLTVKSADDVDSDIAKRAEEAFKRSEYQKAAGLYTQFIQPSDATNPKIPVRDRINLGETLFALGQFKEGFPFFDARLHNPDGKRKPLQKPWDGNCEKGQCKLLLIRGEHGIGDTFGITLRNAKAAHDAGIPVAVRERGFLMAIIKRQSYISQVIKSDEEEAKLPYTADMYGMSGGRYLSNMSYSTGYIEPDTNLVAKWKTQFNDKQKLHVLIGAYRASANIAGECRYLRRDVAIAALIKKLAKPNVALYYACSGDYKPVKRSDYEKLKSEGKLDTLKNFDATLDIVEDADWDKLVLLGGADFNKSGAFEDDAAAMCAADYVISVDTAAGQLAGALGVNNVKNFAVLLPKESDWRWGEGQPKDSPLFANAQLFWQKEQGDWSAPLDALGETIAHASDVKESGSAE
jgi:hypothetical protein